MSTIVFRTVIAALLAAPILIGAGPGAAQDRGQNGGPGGFLNNLFSRGEPQNAPPQGVPQQGGMPADDAGRLGRIENARRDLTGTIERLQFENQQLKAQIQRMQEDNEFRFRQLGAKSPAPSQSPSNARPAAPAAVPPAAAQPGRRSDVFDPSQNPNAPGAPRTLGGNAVAGNTPPGNSIPGNSNPGVAPILEPETAPVGAPGGRAAGAPLDLSTLAGSAATAAPPAGNGLPPAAGAPAAGRAGPQMATLAPSQSPKDEYDLAYGYVLRKDYALAEQAFQTFLKKHQASTLEPDARYWLGETYFQRQRYQDAADAFLIVVRNFENSGKGPDALLRLGQSLAAMEQKELACASFGEVARKYPRASGGVKRAVEQEQKRIKC
ncbi:MAG: tol-pal system protein YbgF [Xanthobacteraceae bacterium]